MESLTGFTSEDDVEETSDQSMSDVDGKKYKSQVWKFLQTKAKSPLHATFVMLFWHITVAPALCYST